MMENKPPLILVVENVLDTGESITLSIEHEFPNMHSAPANAKLWPDLPEGFTWFYGHLIEPSPNAVLYDLFGVATPRLDQLPCVFKISNDGIESAFNQTADQMCQWIKERLPR
jgi:hypothetical protein